MSRAPLASQVMLSENGMDGDDGGGGGGKELGNHDSNKIS